MINRAIAPGCNFSTKIPSLNYDSYFLENGIPVYAIHDKDQEICGLELIFEGGKRVEPVPGASYFATHLLTAGTSQYTKSEINKFFELRGAFVQMQAGIDICSFNLYCLSNQLNNILPFFAHLFLEPAFPNEQIEKLKTQKKQSIKINEQKSSYNASKILRKYLFGKHPYSHILSENDINNLNKRDIVKYWHHVSVKSLKFISLAGNFKDDALKNLNTFFGLQSINRQTSSSKIKISPNYGLVKNGLKNSRQASLKLATLTISPTHEKYPLVSLTNTILGGYFGSRLMQSIREDKGLTYGIHSSIVHLKDASYVQISADVKKGSTTQVIELIWNEVNKLGSQNISNQEITKVINYLIGSYLTSTDNIFDKMAKIKHLKLHNLSDNFYSIFYQQIASISSKQIKQTTQEYFNRELFTTALVE